MEQPVKWNKPQNYPTPICKLRYSTTTMDIDKKTLEEARLAYISKNYTTIQATASAYGIKTTTLHRYVKNPSISDKRPPHHNAH